MQGVFAETCHISAAYLSDIERGRRNPPSDKVILEWAGYLDPGNADEIGQELIGLAAQDRGRADAVAEMETEPADNLWSEETVSATRRSRRRRRSRDSNRTASEGKSEMPFLEHFCVDLVAKAREGELDATPGRSQDFTEIAWRFGCRQRSSVVLISEVAAETHRVAVGLACELEYCRAANGALVDCFRPHFLRELDRDEVLRALYEAKDRFESHHVVTYAQEALVAIVDAAEASGEPERLWQRALDVMDEAGSLLRMEGGKEVTVEVVDGIAASSE